MRMVEQISRMLAGICAHRNAGRDLEAAHEIDVHCRQTIGLPLELVRRSSPEALWELLQQSGGLSYPRAIMLAELLLHDAELSKTATRTADATLSQLHAYCLLAESISVLSSDDVAIYGPRLEALAIELESLSRDPYVQQKLHAYRTKQRSAAG